MHHLPSRYISCDGRLTASAYFNHAPRRGSDVPASQGLSGLQAFQSTLPAWGATTNDVFEYELSLDFNPRSPWGGATCPDTLIRRIEGNFNPRSPQGERPCGVRLMIKNEISIHAPRRGSDTYASYHQLCNFYFNPRSPQGERPPSCIDLFKAKDFNPRSPQGERLPSSRKNRYMRYFNPRSPQGERPPIVIKKGATIIFQSTLPAGGATWVCERTVYE